VHDSPGSLPPPPHPFRSLPRRRDCFFPSVAAKKNPEKETAGRGKFFYFVLACALVAAGGWFWNSRTAAPAAEGATAEPVKSTLHLETFVLNLAGPDQRSYLRVGIDLGLGRELGKGENAAVAEARDTILGVLGQWRVEDLQDEKGKAKLKADLLRALQERMPGLGVEEVYFTEFLIQR
jgi:flagellar basal body-associated protein FliL